MQTNNINSNDLNNFWSFVDTLNFDSNSSNAETVRRDLLKRLTPNTAELYKEVCDKLAYQLYKTVTTKNIPLYLYACYEAIAKGKEYYSISISKPGSIVTLSESIDPLNHFGNCLPTDTDYYGSASTVTAEVNEFEEDYLN